MEIRNNSKQLELILELFRTTQKDDMNYVYRGIFTQNITDGILSLAERNIEDADEPFKIKRRVYFIMIESLQNITRYQAEEEVSEEKAGIFIIQKKGPYYFITTGNLIENEKIDYVESRLKKINSLDKKQLRGYYKEILTNGKFTNEGGAGLGLIEMARKSGNNLSFMFKKFNEKYSFFYLHTAIPHLKPDDEYIAANPNLQLDYIIELHRQLREQKITLIFNSGFSQESLLGLLSVIESQILKVRSIKKTMFNIIVEMLQNIIHHGIDNPDSEVIKPGIFFIQELANEYYINTGNYLPNKKVQDFKEKLNKINKMEDEELDNYFNKRLFDFAGDTSKKAGLGIIDMRLKSDSKLVFNFHKVNEEISFFTLQVSIDKKNNRSLTGMQPTI